MAAGLRVIRGPDWSLDDSDGGEGHVGTVEQIEDNKMAKVIWDGGQSTECRASNGQGYDLRVLDNATVDPSSGSMSRVYKEDGIYHHRLESDHVFHGGIIVFPYKFRFTTSRSVQGLFIPTAPNLILRGKQPRIQHRSIQCDECGQLGILGMRWKCTECFDFDLCSLCYFNDSHDCNHQFYRIETPGSQKEKQEKRSKSMKMRVLGIFPDATVARGKDWEWKDQDGGEGKTGTVLEILTPAPHSARSTVKVKWENGRSNIYRLGYKGKMDLQFVEEAPGIECYPDHLPVLDVDHYKEVAGKDGAAAETIAEGDSVIITADAAQLQELQKSRSGWAIGMAQCIGKVGKVLGFAPNGDAIVSFGNKKYRLNPAALKKVSNLAVGSHVRILDDEEKVKMLQEGHGGYNERMRHCLGKVGKVMKIDSDGDIVVQFGDRNWVFAPACCVAAPDAEIDHISSHDDGGDAVKVKLGDNDSSGDLLGLLAALAQMTGGGLASEGLFLKAIAEREEDRALGMLQKEPKLANSGTDELTALHVAANRGLMRITTALVEAGADLNKKDKDGDTPLMAALAGGCDQVSLYLVKKGCELNATNKDGQTASHKAAISGFTHVLQALLTGGADFNVQDETGDTPLHDCITKSRIDAAEVILSWPGLNLRRANQKGHPPLHFACMKDQPGIVERIIRRDKTLVDDKKNDGYTPLHVCACNDHVQAMRILIEKGDATVNIMNNEKQFPLHIAAHEAAFDCVKLLVQHGADVKARDGMGNTPLHVTLAGLIAGSTEVGRILMLLGQRDKVKEEVRTQLACFLVQRGADPIARNNDGVQALDACPPSHERVKEAIKRFIANNRSAITEGRQSPEGAAKLDALCFKCCAKEAQILLVPCGHRNLCRECSSGFSRCPTCNQPIKQMFDKDGRKLKVCIVM